MIGQKLYCGVKLKELYFEEIRNISYEFGSSHILVPISELFSLNINYSSKLNGSHQKN